MTSVLRRPVGGLPSEVTSFVGRKRELAEVRRGLGGARLLTLTGMGGVGKTRLALRAAVGLRKAFPDGVWLAELGEVQDPDALTDELASVLGLDIDSREPWVALTRFVADKRLLLVLDNCEHLLDACAELTDRLLSASEGLRVLATSRQPLDIAGERTLAVASLAVPDAGGLAPGMLAQYDGVALFVDRAKAILPGFTVTDDNCELVVELCRRLDGIPLAIELTAARLRSLSLPQILDRLADRFALLTTGNRSAPGRQQTLQALVDWSYNLCTRAERTLWARLSVFAGGFDLPAAAAVSGVDEDDAADLVAGLVEKSVVGRTENDGRTRFWMLETIRQYGHDRLVDAGERNLVAGRHRDWFKRLVTMAEDGWTGPDQLTWYRRVSTESANLRLALDFCLAEDGGHQAALELATALCAHRRACSSLSEGRRWLDRVLAEVSEPSPARARALWVNAWLSLLQGDIPAARSLLRESRDTAERIGDASAAAHVVQFSALADLFDGDSVGAVARFGEAVALHRAAGDVYSARLSILQQTMARCFAGDPTAADAIGRAKEVLRATPNPLASSYLYWYEAVERFVKRDRGASAAPAAHALRIASEIGERWLVALSMETLAWVAADLGDHVRAARVLGAAETARRTIGSRLSGLAYLRTHHDACERSARAAIGDDQFDSAYQAGSAMKESQAVSYAAALGTSPHKARGSARLDASPLTAREREIAGLVARGLSNQEIAESLVIARRTAETHVGHILTKLGFSTRAQIAAWASEHGPPEPC